MIFPHITCSKSLSSYSKNQLKATLDEINNRLSREICDLGYYIDEVESRADNIETMLRRHDDDLDAVPFGAL